MRRIAAAIIAGMIAGPCLAGGDVVSDATFAGRTIDWEFGEQRFSENGRTRDRLFRDRHGWWEVRDGTLCMLWPPRDDWDCVTVTLGPGGAVRFEFRDGIVTDGQFRE